MNHAAPGETAPDRRKMALIQEEFEGKAVQCGSGRRAVSAGTARLDVFSR